MPYVCWTSRRSTAPTPCCARHAPPTFPRLRRSKQPECLVEAEHQVEVLHGAPGRAFAEIVEACNQQDLVGIPENEELDEIRFVRRDGSQVAVFELSISAERHHAHERLTRVAAREDCVY